jgi:hypothetical protein
MIGDAVGQCLGFGLEKDEEKLSIKILEQNLAWHGTGTRIRPMRWGRHSSHMSAKSPHHPSLAFHISRHPPSSSSPPFKYLPTDTDDAMYS